MHVLQVFAKGKVAGRLMSLCTVRYALWFPVLKWLLFYFGRCGLAFDVRGGPLGPKNGSEAAQRRAHPAAVFYICVRWMLTSCSPFGRSVQCATDLSSKAGAKSAVCDTRTVTCCTKTIVRITDSRLDLKVLFTFYSNKNNRWASLSCEKDSSSGSKKCSKCGELPHLDFAVFLKTGLALWSRKM